jgi:VWFA-related protein
MTPTLRLISTSVLLLFAAVAVPAQQPALTETIDVRITDVEFVVTDLQGRFVEGLGRDDFEIYENGKKQEITNFYAVTPSNSQDAPLAGTVSAPSFAGPTPSKTARRLIFYFDNASLDFANRREIAESAKTFVRSSFRPGDQVLIATWNGSLQVAFGWSGDLAAFATAVDAVSRATGGAAARDTQRKQIMTQIESMLTDEGIASRPGGQGGGPTFEMLLQSGRRYAEEVRGDVARQSEAIGRLLASLAGVEGRKVLILAAEGLAAQPGAEVFQQLENVKQKTGGRSGSRIGQTGQAQMPLVEMQKYDTGPILRSLGKIANAAGVTIYGINPKGLNTFSKDSGTTERIGIQEMNVEFAQGTEGFQGLEALATQTGGLAIVGAPANVAFTKVGQDLSAYYSVGYRSRAGDSAERSIEVRAKKTGLRIRSRKTFVYRSISDEMADRVIANQLQEGAINDLGISLQADASKADGSRRLVPVRILVPVEKLTLLPDGDSVAGGFSVFVCTGDGKGDVSGVNMQTHSIRWPKEALPHLRSKNVTYAVEVPVEGTREQISVGVIDIVSQTTGFSRIRPLS